MKNLPDNYTDKNGLTQPQGALVSIDPRNGHILAMVGAAARTASTGPAWPSASPGRPLSLSSI